MALPDLHSGKFLSTLIFTISIFVLSLPSSSQPLPDVPFDLDFAGVTVHLTQPNRLKVKQEIERMYANRADVQAYVSSTRQLVPLLKPLLSESDIPNDFLYAALPVSDTDTLGFWGLSKTQGKRLKLRVDDTIDERFHPLLSTEAVVETINRMQKTQKNYVASLLHYLNGELNPPAPDRVNSYYILPGPQNSDLFWKILARKLVFDHEEPTYRSAGNYILYEYQDSEGKTLQSIVDQLQITEGQVKPFNQWLKSESVPTDKDYSIFIQVTPDEFAYIRSMAEARKKGEKSPQPDVGFPLLIKTAERGKGIRTPAIYYTINGRKGIQAQNCDNFITLAFYGNVTINTFLKYNDLTDRDVTRPGQIYYLERKAKRAKIPFHVVEKNQTLREISNMYGVKLKSLLKYNRVSPTQRVQTGRIVWLQSKRPARKPVEYRQLPVEERPEPILKKPMVVTKPVEQPTAVAEPPRTNLEERSTDTLAVVKKEAVTKFYDKPEPEVSENKVETAVNSYTSAKWHTVVPGETYFSIARRYAIPVQKLYDWNNRTDWDMLKVGEKLIVKPALPISQKVGEEAPNAKKDNLVNLFEVNHKEPLYYTVQPGQTVYRIALINKVSVNDLMRWNNLTNYTIEVGQKLLIRK